MKKIEAIIKPFKLAPLKDRLLEAGVSGMTIQEVKGFGEDQGQVHLLRGTEYPLEFTPKVLITLIIEDEYEEKIVEAIQDECSTGHSGDGMVYVTDLSRVVRIRTGEAMDS